MGRASTSPSPASRSRMSLSSWAATAASRSSGRHPTIHGPVRLGHPLDLELLDPDVAERLVADQRRYVEVEPAVAPEEPLGRVEPSTPTSGQVQDVDTAGHGRPPSTLWGSPQSVNVTVRSTAPCGSPSTSAC